MEKKELTKKYLNYIVCAAIVLISFVLFILMYFDVLDFKVEWKFPWFFVFLAIGFGIFFIVKAVLTKNKLNMMMVATILLLFAEIYMLAALTNLNWWFLIIAAFALAAIMMLIGLAIGSFRKSDLADNDQEGYKTYFERKEEESAKPEKEEPPMPEIKSFKDEDK